MSIAGSGSRTRTLGDEGAPQGGAERTWSARLRAREERRRQLRLQDATLGWKEWLRERYAPYWFIFGIVFLDVSISGFILEGQAPPEPAWRYGVSLLLVVLTWIGGLWAYRRLWPGDKEEEEPKEFTL